MAKKRQRRKAKPKQRPDKKPAATFKPPPARVILVIGMGRSGTSLLAGVCHHLGVFMGDRFMPTDNNNQSGTFEDIDFFNVNRAKMRGVGVDYRRLITDRGNLYKIWGVKDPALVHVLPDLLPLLGDDVRVIHAKRNNKAIMSSFERAYSQPRAKVVEWFTNQAEAVNRAVEQLQAFKVPILSVDYEALTTQPAEAMPHIANFIYEGTGQEPPDPAAALAHVDPKLQHWDHDGKWIKRISAAPATGWGSVAVGIRVGKHPEPATFIDWTGLVTRGLDPGDTVLMPRAHMPAHWAADALVRDFLRTDKDSLLMIDDDMTFAPDALAKLRHNEKNWDYDIAFAFCTWRTEPPKPVIYRLVDEQPPEPMSRQGEYYIPVVNFQDGELVEPDAVGLAFTLIRRHVFEAMIDHDYGPVWQYWFESLSRRDIFRETAPSPDGDLSLEFTSFFNYGEGKESDDIPFSRRVRELGYRMVVDTSVMIGHIGHQPLGWPHFKRWRAAEQRKTQTPFDVQASKLIPLLKEALPNLDENKAAAEWLLENLAK